MQPPEPCAATTTKGYCGFLELFADYFNNQKQLIVQQQALLRRMNSELRHGEQKCAEEPRVSQLLNLRQGSELGIHVEALLEH